MLFFVGPLPPPVHGFSNINLQMLDRLRITAKVRVFNTAPVLGMDTLGAKIKNWFRRGALMISFFWFCIFERPKGIYIGLSGGLGQISDAIHIAVARLTGTKVFIHHHSFAYLHNVKFYNRLCMRLSSNSRHILLCENMAEKFVGLYGIDIRQTVVLSNGAFLQHTEVLDTAKPITSSVLTLGFLSNITAEKGIEEFFDIVKRLQFEKLPVKALVAGPVAAEIESHFFEMLKNSVDVKYLGPVYGKEKKVFFETIDLLLFPTKYVNEAEPLTIIEAMRCGIPVLAAGRGCIASMIDDGCGKVFPLFDHFVVDATGYIKSLLGNIEMRSTLSTNAYKNFRDRQLLYSVRLDALILEIAGIKR